MISSVFDKTKPINYIIILAFLFIFHWFVHFYLIDATYSVEQIFLKTSVLAILMFSIFVVNFVVKRNKMTGPNSFAILLYALLMVVFPETLTDNNAVLCSFFLLLATRRLISIRSLRNIKLKIFDATLWVMASSLFYDWAILYLLLVFAAIYIYEPKNIRNWLVPLTGIFAFMVIMYCVYILAGVENLFIEHYTFEFDLNFSYYLNWGNSSKLIVYVLLTFLATLIAFVKLGKSGVGKIVVIRLMALSFFLGLLLKVLVSSPMAHPIMVTFFPSVVFLTNYVETIQRPNIKELVLITMVIAPFIVLISTIIFR